MPPVRVCVVRRCPTPGALLPILVLLFAPLALPQEKLVTSQETNERIRQLSTLLQVHQGEYVIGSGDLLTIQVFDVTELSRDVRVSEQGTISLPLLPARLHAAGLTEIQVEQKLEEVLASSGLVTHPQVSVAVKERKSNPITVIGAVAHPMVYQAVRTVTLLEVLSEAGGISNDAGSVVLITRRNPNVAAAPAEVTNPSVTSNPNSDSNSMASSPDTPVSRGPAFPSVSQEPPSSQEIGSANEPPSNVLTVNLIDLLETGDPKYDIRLQGGDVVRVPKAGIVYVMGAVERPGGFVLSNDRDAMSVLKVMALAGGPKSTAKSSQSLILRKMGSVGQQQELHLDLKKLMEHKTEDVRLNAGDIVFVPDSSGKRAARRVGEIALAISTGAAIFRLAR
jgi:polysaccharide export outer membrane protein